MKTRILGRTSIDVSEIGLGTWPIGNNGIGEYGPISESEAISMIRRYIDLGGNFIDTARAYGERSERLIGEAIHNYVPRKQLVIATKTVAGEQDATLSMIRSDLEESLRLLNTDYVDLMQLHQPPEDLDTMNRALDELETLRSEGKIKYIGASIKGPNVTSATIDLCRQYIGSGRIDAIQLVYSILRQKLDGLIAEAQQQGVGIVVRTVLESGLLTGEFAPGHRFTGIDQRARYRPENLDFILRSVHELSREISLPKGYVSLTQLAIRFSLALSGVSTLILGAQAVSEVEENLATTELNDLPEELLESLRKRFAETTELANYF